MIKQSGKIATCIISIVFISTSLMAMGEPPAVEETPTPSANIETVETEPSSENMLNEDQIFDLGLKIKKQLKNKQFSDVILSLKQIPKSKRTKKQNRLLSDLLLFENIEKEVAESSSVFAKEDDLDEDTQKKIVKLFNEAKIAIINDNPSTAKDILIQILYFHRRNMKARAILEKALDLPLGSYKIEDIETKYWKKSKVFFYGGNYMKAIEILNTLALFDKDNSTIYERLGSSYFMLGENKKAVGAWNTALFLKPNNKQLKTYVEKANKLIKEEEASAKAALLAKKKAKNKKKDKKEKIETQRMGLFGSRDQAYTFAGKLRKQGMSPIVEEQSNGKWSVSVPKNLINKKGSK